MKSEIGYLLKVIQENAERRANQMYKPVDLTSSQVRLMKYVRSREGHVATQKEIEHYFQVSHPTVVGIVQRLEHKGLIRTEMDERDKRRKLIFLTEREEELFQQMKNFHGEMEKILTAGMSGEQISQLSDLLNMVLCNLKEREER